MMPRLAVAREAGEALVEPITIGGRAAPTLPGASTDAWQEGAGSTA
jgi:hypothetical protein